MKALSRALARFADEIEHEHPQLGAWSRLGSALADDDRRQQLRSQLEERARDLTTRAVDRAMRGRE